jgi:hypothetical protein
MRIIMRSSTHPKPSPRPWAAVLLTALAVGAISLLAVAHGLRLPFSLARFAPNAETEPLAVASIAGGKPSTTIILSTPNSNDCQRYQLNVTTGVRSDQGTGNCAGEAANGPTRLEAISKSFRNH